MIRYKNSGVEMDLDLTCYAEIISDDIDNYYVKSVFDNHIISKRHKNSLSGESAIYYDRLLYLWDKQKNRL